jgi:putative hemolysin
MKAQYLNLEVAHCAQAGGEHRAHCLVADEIAAERVTGIARPAGSECCQDGGDITVFLCGDVTLDDLFTYRS